LILLRGQHGQHGHYSIVDKKINNFFIEVCVVCSAVGFCEFLQKNPLGKEVLLEKKVEHHGSPPRRFPPVIACGATTASGVASLQALKTEPHPLIGALPSTVGPYQEPLFVF
jgi:hypothetical protein